jgi:Asp-tRNA(Asn)/Glu-tRNA(Gln) amidotransferase A subunit family amidase
MIQKLLCATLALLWKISNSNNIGSIQLVGRLDSDLQLLSFAEQIERARDIGH